MSSLKMTFSLASLVLLMALVAIPVMAHDLIADEDGAQHVVETTLPRHGAHPVVKSITADSSVNDGYVGGDSFLVTITFESEDEDKKISVPTGVGTVVLDAAGFEVVGSVVKVSDTVYTVRLRRTSAGDEVTITVVAGTNAIYTPADPLDEDDEDDPTMNPAKLIVVYDETDPAIPAVGEVNEPAISAVVGQRSPVGTDGWATSFELEFTVTDAAAGDSLDFDSVMFTTDPPDELVFDMDTFGSIGLNTNRYGITVTPATVDKDETDTKDVQITISVSDKVGNTATETIMVTLAPRTATEDPTDPADPGDPRVDITVSNIGDRSFRIAINVIPDVVLDADGKEVKGDGLTFKDYDPDKSDELIGEINDLLDIKDITGREITLELAKEGDPLEDITPVSGKNQFIADVTYDGFTVPPLTITVNQDPKKGGLKTSNKDDEWDVSSTTDTSAPALGPIESELQDDKTVEFTFTFDKAVPRTGNGAFTAADLTVTGVEELDADGELMDVSVKTDDYTVFTLTLTPEPNADGDIEVMVALKANSVWIVAGDSVATMSATYMPEVETVAPTVTVEAADALDSDGNAVFTITFTEELGTGFAAFDVEDLTIEGADETVAPVLSGPVGDVYTLTVTPLTTTTSVTVTVGAQIADISGNPVDLTDADSIASATFDNEAPTVAIAAPLAPESDGNLMFTFVFSEPIDPETFNSNDIRGSGFSIVASVPQMMMSAETETTETWTVKVTPEAANTAVTVAINAGAVQDMNGNPLAAGMTATYVPGASAAPADLTATAGDGKVTLQWTVIAGKTYQYRKKSGTETFMADDTDYMDIAAADLMAVTGSTTMMMFDVTGLTGGTAYTFQVRVKGDGDTPAGAAATEMATPTIAVTGGLAEGDTRHNVTSETEFTLSGTLASNSFVIVAPMARADIDGTEIVIAALPNLQRFFAKGGTISVIGGASKSVVISEIMWGLNQGVGIDSQADSQWIELLNPDNALTDTDATNAAAAAIDLSDYTLVFTPGTTLPTPDDLADQISNVELGGWTVDIGQSGSLGRATETFSPVNMVSMYRNINFENLTKKHGDKNAADNKTQQLKAIPDGKLKGNWKPSLVSDTYAANQQGSPGAQHFVGRAVFDATSVGRNAVVITEVGNNATDAYDWVELTAIADTGLKDYELQYIEGQNITVLAQFVEKTLEAGEILVVLQSNPRNNPEHPVAAGKEWKVADADRDNTGTASLYHVDSKLVIPNDKGKGLFVLRSAKDKTNHENIVDLAGNSFVTDNSSAYRTRLWPLRATAAGNSNVIDGDVEDFNSGRVYQRNNRDSGTGAKDWSVRGYTGIGYKRSAANNGQNGGTPGFDNGALKEKSSDLAGDAAVTISEIMYDRGARNNLPQWIELHNASATQAVNLNEWKLKIENDSDVDVRDPLVTIANLGGTIIPPNQTVLIVAYTTGRVSRGSQGRDDFPTTRVISLSGKGELEIPSDVNKRNYRLLSGTAFKLTLTEKGGAMVDTVGNLGADPAWDLPMAEDGEGRSSIIRGYGPDRTDPRGAAGYDMAQDGTMAPSGDGTGSWVLAAKSDLSEVRVNETFYGNPDDVGTPGFRGGGALPVSLSKFRPERLDSGDIVIRWITESELNNAGFNILRSETRNGQFTQINTSLIAGQGTTSERMTYEWKDSTAKPNVVYYYQIQDVSLDGKVQTLRQSRLKGNVSAAGKITTTWGELKALQ